MIGRINAYRLINQHLARSKFTKPEDLVTSMVAIQAQEYAMSKWAVGLRVPGSKDQDVENAFNAGSILRTHIMRPTWHFVAKEDIRWMIQLTAPRVHQSNSFTYRQMELDTPTLVKCTRTLEKSLTGGKFLTRSALNSDLKQKGISAEGIRLSAIMMYAELEGVICSGPRDGKQFTYALLEERVPAIKPISDEEALNKLTNRYFKSRGPATLHDFATWSGLTLKQSREGIANLGPGFSKEIIDGKDYIFETRDYELTNTDQTSFLMPDYDEYGMSYKDRSALMNPRNKGRTISRENPIFNRMIVLKGRIEGTWSRSLKGNSVQVDTYPFVKLNNTETKALENAVRRYVEFTENLTKKK
ncbi:MAG: winged helix DNA-binding domain-containing protein [Bacteroidota bacterium]